MTPEESAEISRQNMNKPISELVCPKCGAKGVAENDYDMSDHPGVFFCKECHYSFMA